MSEVSTQTTEPEGFVPSDYTYCPDHDAVFLAFMQLMPKGTAWDNIEATTNRSSVIRQFMSAISLSWLHFEDAMCVSLDEWICKTSDEDIDMWAREYGVPDDCDIYNQSLCAKVVSTGSATAEYLNSMMEASGYSVEGRWLTGTDIEFPGVHSTFRVVVDPINSSALKQKPVLNFPLGVGVRLGDIGGNQIEDLECMLARYVPAHCVVDVSVSGDFDPGDLGSKLKAWWKSDTTANGPVANWLDTVSSMAASSTASNRPVSEVVEGYRVVTFDGEDDYLRTGTLTVHPSGDGVSEVFSLFNKTAFGGAAAMLINETDGAGFDFLTDDTSRRVAVKAAGSTIEYALRDFFFSSLVAQPKRVWDRTGLMVWTAHNLVQQSEDITQAAWSKGSSTAVTATFLRPTAVSNFHSCAQAAPNPAAIIGETYTYTVVASAGGYNKIGIRGDGSTNEMAVDLAAGTILYSTAGFTPTITSLGGGQYQIIVTWVATLTTAAPAIYVLPDSYTTGVVTGSWLADGTKGINIFRQQLNRGPVPLTYLKTTALTRSAVPLDYNPISHEPEGLLAEFTVTNLCIWSQDFDNAAWNKTTAVTVTPNVVIAPDGTMTMDKIVNAAQVGANHQIIGTTLATTAGSTYIYSIFAKAADGFDWISLSESNGSGNYTFFNVRTGTPGTRSAQHSAHGIINCGNGLYRCWFAMAAILTTSNFTIYLRDKDNQPAVFNWPNSTDGIYLWGAQVELANVGFPYPTSYVPTFSVAVGRTGDGYLITSAQINHSGTAGSWWAEVRTMSAGAQSPAFIVYTSTAKPLYYYSAGIGIADTQTATKAIAPLHLSVHKLASAFAPNDMAVTADGLPVATSAASTCVNLLNPGANIAFGSNTPYTYIRRAYYLPRRTTNTEIVTNTTMLPNDMYWTQNTVLGTFDMMQWDASDDMDWRLE